MGAMIAAYDAGLRSLAVLGEGGVARTTITLYLHISYLPESERCSVSSSGQFILPFIMKLNVE
jgi:hypothetical protein